jgi:hypothetical protein
MKQSKTKNIWVLLIALSTFSILLGACSPAEPKVDIDAQRTSFAQTADAQASATAEAMPTAAPTEIPPATVTPTPEASPTPSESATETDEEGETPTEPAQPTPPPGGGSDDARWMANDPPDNTNFAPGEEFTVTWTLENSGTSTWSTQYYIQYASGATMGVAADAKVTIPYPVPPNTNVQISVNFIAPEEAGEKRSDWKLFNASGNAFYDFYIIIDVVPSGE